MACGLGRLQLLDLVGGQDRRHDLLERGQKDLAPGPGIGRVSRIGPHLVHDGLEPGLLVRREVQGLEDSVRAVGSGPAVAPRLLRVHLRKLRSLLVRQHAGPDAGPGIFPDLVGGLRISGTCGIRPGLVEDRLHLSLLVGRQVQVGCEASRRA